MTQILLTYNAAVNVQDEHGNTALHYCMEKDNWPILEILLKYGASADIKNNRVNKFLYFYISKMVEFFQNESHIKIKRVKPQSIPHTNTKTLKALKP